MKKLLFTIPIYIQDEKKSISKYNRKKNDFILNLENGYKKYNNVVPETEKLKWASIAENEYYMPWKYNEIIGWIEILYNCETIFPYLYIADSNRYSPRQLKKIVKPNHDIFNKIPHNKIYIKIGSKSNSEILAELKDLIKEIKKILPRKYFYIDLDIIENIIPVIDFEKLKNSN